MAKPLDGIALQTYYHRFGFGKAVRDKLDEIRTSPPSRTPESRRGNMPVSYPSKKMQCIIKAESHKGEFAFLIEVEHDEDVIEYYDQPPSIPLEYRDKRNHLHRPLHTADYFVFRFNSAGWVECKPTQELIRISKTYSNRYEMDEQGNWRCPPGEKYAAEFGLTYSVHASDQINWAAQDNWLYIEDYYQDLERLVVSETNLERLYQLVDENPGITLADLRLEASEIPSDEINIAIVRHSLYVDLNHHRLSEPWRAQVFRDQPTALTYRHRGEEALDLGIAAHPVEIVQGQTIDWDGKPWRINVGKTEITLVADDCKPFPLKRSDFEALIKSGKIVGVQTNIRSSITAAGQEKLLLGDSVAWAKAVFRNRVINPDQYDDEEQQQINAIIDTIPERTRFHWKRLYREAEIRDGSGILGLLPDYHNCGGAKKIPSQTRELIHTVLETHYNTITRKPKRGAYGEFLLQCEEQNIPKTTQRTFYAEACRYTSIYDEILAREGARAAYPFKDYFRPDEKTISRHGNYAWSMGHLDHMEVDLELCDSKTGKPMGKCWLTLLILSQPRRIAAYYLTFDPPSYRSCMMVLRLCVKRYGRLPTAITVDGGSEFKSIYFEKLLALYKVRKHRRPSSEPRFGSPLERLFGTLDTQFIYHLIGNTQATKRPRTNTKITDPSRNALWTLQKLAERLQQWADEEYDTLRHPALGQSPREAYQQSLEQDGERIHKLISYDDVFEKATFPTTYRGKSIVQPGVGVRMNYLDYWCEEMRDRTVQLTEVPVCYDPFDASIGYAYINKKWRKCHCPYDEFAGCSERELHILTEELRKRNRIQYGSEQVEITQKQLAAFRRECDGDQDVLRQQRNDRETRTALKVLEGGRTRSLSDSALNTSVTSESNVETTQKSSSVQSRSHASQMGSNRDKLIVFRRAR
jgi:putative transposase